MIRLKRSRCDSNDDSTATTVRSMANSNTIILRPPRVQYAASTTFQRPCYDYTTITHDILTTSLRSMRSFYVLTTVILRTIRLYYASTATVLRSLTTACPLFLGGSSKRYFFDSICHANGEGALKNCQFCHFSSTVSDKFFLICGGSFDETV